MAGASIHLLHLIFLAMWGGVLGCEFILEAWLPRRGPTGEETLAALHYYIDLGLELPLLLGVIVTGLLLLAGRPIDARLAVKLAGAAIALAANLTCVVLVVVRHRGDKAKLARRTRAIRWTAIIGVPAGFVALYIGLGYAGLLGV
jgi:hypothetical protein